MNLAAAFMFSGTTLITLAMIFSSLGRDSEYRRANNLNAILAGIASILLAGVLRMTELAQDIIAALP